MSPGCVLQRADIQLCCLTALAVPGHPRQSSEQGVLSVSRRMSQRFRTAFGARQQSAPGHSDGFVHLSTWDSTGILLRTFDRDGAQPGPDLYTWQHGCQHTTETTKMLRKKRRILSCSPPDPEGEILAHCDKRTRCIRVCTYVPQQNICGSRAAKARDRHRSVLKTCSALSFVSASSTPVRRPHVHVQRRTRSKSSRAPGNTVQITAPNNARTCPVYASSL